MYTHTYPFFNVYVDFHIARLLTKLGEVAHTT